MLWYCRFGTKQSRNVSSHYPLASDLLSHFPVTTHSVIQFTGVLTCDVLKCWLRKIGCLVSTLLTKLLIFERDSTIVSLADTGTSILAGITIFSILGNLAYESGKPITEVVNKGPGLAFISYPEAISKFDVVPQVNQSSILDNTGNIGSSNDKRHNVFISKSSCLPYFSSWCWLLWLLVVLRDWLVA